MLTGLPRPCLRQGLAMTHLESLRAQRSNPVSVILRFVLFSFLLSIPFLGIFSCGGGGKGGNTDFGEGVTGPMVSGDP